MPGVDGTGAGADAGVPAPAAPSVGPVADGTAPRTLATAQDTRNWGRELAGSLRAGDLVILVGALGAGKTTFVQGLAEGLGVRGPVTSPTFVIARSHPSTVGGPALVHVDAYRLGDSLELDDLDLDTEVESAVTVVEWGEGLAESLGTGGHLVVHLDRAAGSVARLGGTRHDAPDDVDAGSEGVGAASQGVDASSQGVNAGSGDDRSAEEAADPRVGQVFGVGPRWQGWPLRH